MLNKLQELLGNPSQVESLDAVSVLTTLAVSALCGLMIFLVYRFFNKGVVYNSNFNLLILMICVVTAFIIITIGANLVLSLGMVGALSIVRFRAAVKDPLDVGFLFWGVAAGLTSGARLYLVALLGTACIALLYMLFTLVHLEKRSFLLIVRYDPGAEEQLLPLLAPLRYKLKNKTLSSGMSELTAEIKIAQNDTAFLEPLRNVTGVSSATLVEYTGNYT